MNVLYSSVQYWCLKLSPYNLKKYFRKLTKVLINLHKMPRVLDLYDGALNEYRYALQDEFDQRKNMSRAYEDACRGLINYEKSTIKSSAEFNKIFEKIEKDYGVKNLNVFGLKTIIMIGSQKATITICVVVETHITIKDMSIIWTK